MDYDTNSVINFAAIDLCL